MHFLDETDIKALKTRLSDDTSNIRTRSDGEGGTAFVVNHKAIRNALKGNLTDASDLYLELSAKYYTDRPHGMLADGGLATTWDEFAECMKDWNDFLDMYPNYAASEEASRNYIFAMIVYGTGVDNTPVYDRQTKRLDSELKKSYEKFLGDEGNKKYSFYKDFDALYKAWEDSGFVLTPVVETASETLDKWNEIQ
jgi:hypothetical protein